MLVVFGRTMWEAYQSLNNKFLLEMQEPEFALRGADLSVSSMDVNIVSRPGQGWGLPTPEEMPPLFDVVKRTSLLKNRYIHSELREDALDRLVKILPKPRGFPTTVSFPFFRQTHDTPTGGGCLIAATFGWWQGMFQIRIISRASEITKALLADLYLMKDVIGELIYDASVIANVNPTPVLQKSQIVWQVVLASQSRVYSPMYMIHVWPLDKVLEHFTTFPTNPWQQHLQWFFWTRFIYPDLHEKRKMTQRTVEKFWEASKARGYPDWYDIAMQLNIEKQMPQAAYKSMVPIRVEGEDQKDTGNTDFNRLPIRRWRG